MLGYDIGAQGALAAIDFREVFERLPSPYMIVDRDIRYVEANDAYCRTVGRTRQELIGQNLFDLFPNEGPEGLRLRQSFERVLSTGKADALALIPYPIPDRHGGFEMRYWSAAHTPIVDEMGRPTHVVQNTVDVTELQKLKEIAYGPGAEPQPGEKDFFLRSREVEALNRDLMEESQGLRDLFMQAPGFIAVLVGDDLTFALVNNAYLQLTGHRQLIGKSLKVGLPEIEGQGFAELLRQVMATKEPFIGAAISVRLQRAPDAPLEERFVDFIYQPLVRPSGEAWGVLVQGSDVSDRVAGEQQRKLLLDELNHRVKNTLAAVQAIAAQTLRSSPDPQDFRAAFERRLLALSATHELLTSTGWMSAGLKDVISREFRPYDPSRYALNGESVQLSPSEAVALALIVHELATNAAKYGALSTPMGTVWVSWRVDRSQTPTRLSLDWIERGGPTVEQPSRRGFGSRLIKRSLHGNLDGKAELRFDPEGVVCHVALALGAA